MAENEKKLALSDEELDTVNGGTGAGQKISIYQKNTNGQKVFITYGILIKTTAPRQAYGDNGITYHENQNNISFE